MNGGKKSICLDCKFYVDNACEKHISPRYAKVTANETHSLPEKKGWLKRPENVEVSYGETSEENKLVGVGIFLDNEFVQGNKSNCLFQASSMMVSDGFDENFIVDHLLSEWESRRGSRDKFADAKYNICGAFKY